MYAGRMILLPVASSYSRCAHQPEIREVAKMGRQSSVGMPRAYARNAEYRSTFTAIG